MSRKTTCLALALLLLSAGPLLAAAPVPGDSEVDRLFWSRHWDSLEKYAAPRMDDLSPRELAVYANALWLQRQYGRSLEYLIELETEIPPELRPYLEMLVTLGYERTGRPVKAAEKAKTLWERKNRFLAPYAAYALGRLSQNTGDFSGAREWYLKMAEYGRDSRQRRQALQAVLSLPSPPLGDALGLLRESSFDKRALAILSDAGEKCPPDGFFYLGYNAYFDGEYAQAADYLQKVKETSALFDRASYFRGRALYRTGNASTAVGLWKDLALSDSRYASSSVASLRRASIDGDREAFFALETIAASESRSAAAALAALAETVSRRQGAEKALEYEDQLLDRFPDTQQAVDVLWERGWGEWRSGIPEKALESWNRGLHAGSGSRQEPRLLYWMSRAAETAGENILARGLVRRLETQYPLDYYRVLASPGYRPEVSPHTPEYLCGSPGLLESWGFVVYARLQLAGSTETSDIFRAARLALWMGDARGAYLAASLLARDATRLDPLPGPLLEALYPLAWERDVREAAGRFGLDPVDIWSIMRQESGFEAEAASPAGALGLMQLMPPTARENASMLDLKPGDVLNPSRNILLGAHHFMRLEKMFDRKELAFAAYNAGQGSVGRWLPMRGPLDEWIEEIPYDETSNYLKRVLANRDAYRLTHPGLAGSAAETAEKTVEKD